MGEEHITCEAGNTDSEDVVTIHDRRIGYHFRVDNAVLLEYGKQIGPYGIAVYNALCMYAGQNDTAWPSHASIAKITGMSTKQVGRAIKALIDAGLIVQESRTDSDGLRKSNKYELLTVGTDSQSHPMDSQSNAMDVQSAWHGLTVHKAQTDSPSGMDSQSEELYTIELYSNELDTVKEGDACAREADPEPSTNNNSPPPNLGFEQKPKRHEKRLIDGIMEQVKAHDMELEQFRELVDNILTRYGQYELAHLNTDAGTRSLRQAQDTALSLVGLGYRAPPDVDRILQSWRENDWRGDSMPNSNQLVEHAAKMKAGTVEYTRRESKSSTPHVIQVPASVGRFMQ